MSPADAERVQEVFRRASRSLLQYVREAALHATGADRKLRDDVMRVAAEDAAGIAAVGEFLARERITAPHLGSFPMAFTDLNFVGVRYLLPKLVAEQRRAVAALEADAAAITDAGARAAVRELLELQHRHLAELVALANGPA